jgi:hypothetical protein
MSLPDRLLTLLALFALAGLSFAADAKAPLPEARWQEPIQQAVAAVVRQDQDAVQRLEALRDQGRGERGTLLVQLALYLEASRSTEQSMGGAILLRELAFTPEEKLGAILPHLEEARPGLRRVFTEMLSTIDRPEGGSPDYTLYEETLRARRDAPPAALVLYMLEVAPDATLLSLERVFGGREGTLPRAAVRLREALAAGASPDGAPRARAALQELARDPAWWRRLYAASILASHPGLASPGLASELAEDPHPLVRRVALPAGRS